MSTLHHGASASRRLALWIVIAAVMVAIGAMMVVAFAAVGAPAAPTELPLPQPAPVGP